MSGRVASFIDGLLGEELALLRFRLPGVARCYTVQPRWTRCRTGQLATVSDQRWPAMLRRGYDVKLRRNGSWRAVAVTVTDEPALVGSLAGQAGVSLRQPGYAVLITTEV